MGIIEATMYFLTTMVGRVKWSGQALNGHQRQQGDERERETYTSITHCEKLQCPHQQYY